MSVKKHPVARKVPILRQFVKARERRRERRRAIEGLTRQVVALRGELTEALLLRDPRYGDPKRLFGRPSQAFSQNAEDGMIAEVFRRIGTDTERFLEIGVGDGLENNTALLLLLGWRGAWIEGDPECARRIRAGYPERLRTGQLALADLFLTAENVAEVVERLGVRPELDLLSVDLDMNTWYVWRALAHLRPRLAIVEYNPHLPPSVDWKVPYDPRAVWSGGLHFGASLKALEHLGRELGYSLVGCDLMGVNAFFVRDDLVGDHFRRPFTAEEHYEASRSELVRHRGHPPEYVDLPPDA
jgi:hypothetical protein